MENLKIVSRRLEDGSTYKKTYVLSLDQWVDLNDCENRCQECDTFDKLCFNCEVMEIINLLKGEN